VSSVKRERELAAVDIRPMNELDVPVVGAIERAGYQFPWSDGIFRDCLRVGYVCRVVEVNGEMAGYGIMSVGAGEALQLEYDLQPDGRARFELRAADALVASGTIERRPLAPLQALSTP